MLETVREHRDTFQNHYNEQLLRNVAGVVARQVEGVARMGEGLFEQLDCQSGACTDHGHGITVRQWNEDIFLYIHLCCAPGGDTKKLIQTVQTRVRITLDNLLGVRPAAIEVDLQELALPAPVADSA